MLGAVVVYRFLGRVKEQERSGGDGGGGKEGVRHAMRES